VDIEESLVYHLTQKTPTEDPVFIPQYIRDRFGYFRPTSERMLFAREYQVTLETGTQRHWMVLWWDVDEEVFCISHQWINRLDAISDDASLPLHSFSRHPHNHLRVGCYNIWNTNDQWELRSEMIVENILKDEIDFVALQEVRYNIVDEYKYRRAQLERRRFQIQQLKEHLQEKSEEGADQWQYHYHPAMSYMDQFHIDEGLAIFSRFPILECSHLSLTRDLFDEEDAHHRVILRCALDTPQGTVQVFNSHFALTSTARQRAVLELWRWIQQFPLPHIFMGDLNAEPDDVSIQFLKGLVTLEEERGDFIDAYEKANPAESDELTFPSWEPTKRIDFVLLRGFSSVDNYHLLGKQYRESANTQDPHDPNRLWSSDHYGISCDVYI